MPGLKKKKNYPEQLLFSMGLIPGKSADASLLNNSMPERVQTRQNSPPGLTGLALHRAMTLQISEYFAFPETKAAGGTGEPLTEPQQGLPCWSGDEERTEQAAGLFQAPALGSLLQEKPRRRWEASAITHAG